MEEIFKKIKDATTTKYFHNPKESTHTPKDKIKDATTTKYFHNPKESTHTPKDSKTFDPSMKQIKNKIEHRGFRAIEKYGEVNIPKRGTSKSAGYDIESIEDAEIEPNTIKMVSTGLKAYMMDDEVLKIYIRSSLAIKKGLTLANNVGIIDADYYDNPSNEGHIMVALTNMSDMPVTIKKGERIAQGIFEKYLMTDTDEILSNERVGGIGSTNIEK
jgi:dUTP pyrophosphatase